MKEKVYSGISGAKITGKIENTGDMGQRVTVFIFEDDELLYSRSVMAYARAVTEVEVSLLSEPGSHRYTMIVDPANSISEADEFNNIVDTDFTVGETTLTDVLVRSPLFVLGVSTLVLLVIFAGIKKYRKERGKKGGGPKVEDPKADGGVRGGKTEGAK